MGLLALVGIGVWLCQRQRHKSPRAKPPIRHHRQPDVEDVEDVEGKYEEDDGDYQNQYGIHSGTNRDKRGYGQEDASVPPVPILRDPRAVKNESLSESETEATLRRNGGPPPPHPAHQARLEPVLPSEMTGSPTELHQSRTLYPSNPSPNPRHLDGQPHLHGQPHQQFPPQPQSRLPLATRPPSAMRQSAYARRRESLANVHFTSSKSVDSHAPPLPATNAPPSNVRPSLDTRGTVGNGNGGTPPLNIRKSTIPAGATGATGSYGTNGSPPQLRGAVPSYYEATRGGPPGQLDQSGPPSQPARNRPQSRMSIARPSMTTRQDLAPPVPLGSRPGENRRPSPPQGGTNIAPSRAGMGTPAPVPMRRPSEARGGMI